LPDDQQDPITSLLLDELAAGKHRGEPLAWTNDNPARFVANIREGNATERVLPDGTDSP